MSEEQSMFLCPWCNRRVYRQPHSGDLVHACNSGNPTLDQEDVVILGDWIDCFGDSNQTTGGNAASILGTLGIATKNFGQTSWVRGYKDYSRTVRGAKKATHRQRQHYKYFDFGSN